MAGKRQSQVVHSVPRNETVFDQANSILRADLAAQPPILRMKGRNGIHAPGSDLLGLRIHQGSVGRKGRPGRAWQVIDAE